MFRLGLTTFALFFLVWAPAGFAQGKKKADPTRSVQGTVSTAGDVGVKGAVVQLKNVKTLQIRSFITQEKGSYQFHGLDPNVDYTLKADYQGASSPTRTLSSFDSRKKPAIDLKIEAKK